MAWYWYKGQKVVCIEDRIIEGEPGPYVVKGSIYTISGFTDWYGDLCLLFEELEFNHIDKWSDGYNPNCFRPITDISIFHKNIETLKIEEDA